MTDFDGFPKATMTFLRKLAKNNNREWFQDNKASYESDWLEPSLAFIEAMKKPIERSFSPCFVAVPKRVGGSLMRIYRDTRFSKVKTPYKANIRKRCSRTRLVCPPRSQGTVLGRRHLASRLDGLAANSRENR